MGLSDQQLRRCFFFNDTATTEIYTLSLHDALPISFRPQAMTAPFSVTARPWPAPAAMRSEEHTSELQSRRELVCRLLREKKKNVVEQIEEDHPQELRLRMVLLANLRELFAGMALLYYFCFFFNDTATTEIYTLSLHDALPI